MTIENSITLDNSLELLHLIQKFKREYSNSGDTGHLRLAIAFTVMESMQAHILDLKATVEELRAACQPPIQMLKCGY